ncbi:MAG: hypothetical protein ACJAXX_002612 [Roseivirga sp.]|jgi:hypothetical protein
MENQSIKALLYNLPLSKPKFPQALLKLDSMAFVLIKGRLLRLEYVEQDRDQIIKSYLSKVSK